MPRLVIKQGPGVGRDHALGAGECVVGRDAGATFTLEDNLASRRHFKVVAEAGAWYVEDLGSTNGTLVNGQRAQRQRLGDGDVIQAGNTRLTFVQKDMLGGGGAPAKAAPAPAPKVKGPPPPVRRKRHIR
ncbi:MAG: FHA domain-containing protein [Planctomycetota bacterium]|nr:FHA domain-containing protein [Planctomycetota bacterium]